MYNLLKLLIAEVLVDTDEDAVEDESLEEDEEDNEEYGDLLHGNDCDHEAIKFTSHDKTDRDSTETLFTVSFKLNGSSFHKHFQRSLKSCK